MKNNLFTNPSSLNFWHPRIADLNIPIPKTEIILHRKDPFKWWGFLDDDKLSQKDLKILYETARRIGYPLFMRTDLISGKHRYLDCCYVPDEAALIPHLYNIVEDAACKDQPTSSIVLREYIDLDSMFCAFRGLPISAERRYFIDQGKVSCHHPYWIHDAIKFRPGTEPVEGWEDMLTEMNTETDEEIALLTGYAEKIAAVLEGAWSLDFAKSRSGLWYFIDAAETSKSWHPSGCPICPEGQGEKKKKQKAKKLDKDPPWFETLTP